MPGHKTSRATDVSMAERSVTEGPRSLSFLKLEIKSGEGVKSEAI